MKESKFQSDLKRELTRLFPGCMILKQETKQGIPDLLILYNNKWATLECKKSENANKQPNQDYYVDKMNAMSFSSFIFPENKDVVMQELSTFFLGGNHEI